ncbi:hypothetical protein EVAR_27716_1 [Eumeta japonica]|uniref:Uncharacterized protein n=1 Tax=Eumeta variegata TaxID=151549 RepID=A0A4C1WP52_EUMVA|nr:hypothetical protein EVAR_27716_1 [Eumeta japonica]
MGMSELSLKRYQLQRRDATRRARDRRVIARPPARGRPARNVLPPKQKSAVGSVGSVSLHYRVTTVVDRPQTHWASLSLSSST